MTMTRTEVAAWLKSQDNYAILTHRRPDGDTLGTAAALCRILRALGKTAHILENPEITSRFVWLHDGLTKQNAETGDTLVSVDVASPQMLPQCFQKYLGSISLRIDHHASATSFTERELVDGHSGACAEIVWDIARELGVEMDAETADAVYVAVSTDTGCFRFANTTAHTFTVAADCAQAGARVFQLNQEIFETNTLSKLRMQAWIVEHMQLLPGKHLAIVAIPRAVEEELGVTDDDMDNISNFPRTVAGVRMAATLRQTREGDCKLSVRAVPGWDATRITEAFGGGGHKGAAGASMKLPLEEAVKAVKTEMLKL